MTKSTGKLQSAAFRSERARNAALARTTPESALRVLERRAGELDDGQLSRLREVLGRATRSDNGGS